MPRPILATVHPEALRHNLNQARVRAPDARVWAVVKANAYGHGIERCFDALRSADGFALLDLAEAERLRALDWRGPILLLEGVFEPRDLELCSRLHLWHAVHCIEQIDWLAAHKTQVPHRVFLKLNSGMNRLGFTPTAFRAAWARLNALPQVEEISLMTHFSDADGPRGIAHQVAAFEAATHDLPGERSLSNSAALLRHGGAPALRSDWVRTLLFRWEAVNNAWNQYVLGYNPQRQRELLSRLGLPDADWRKLAAALAILLAHDWPGNVRELKNVVERAVYRWDVPDMPIAHVQFDPFDSPWRPRPPEHRRSQAQASGAGAASAASGAAPVAGAAPSFDSIEDLRAAVDAHERAILAHALGKHRWNQRQTARALGLTYDQLRHCIRKHGLMQIDEGD